MRQLIILGIVGLIAQLIDGSLGMAYGVTSTTLLLAAGTAPAAASAAVHFSELGTSLVSGISHHRFGNVDWRVVLEYQAGLMRLPAPVTALAIRTLSSEWGTAFTRAGAPKNRRFSGRAARAAQDGRQYTPVVTTAYTKRPS